MRRRTADIRPRGTGPVLRAVAVLAALATAWSAGLLGAPEAVAQTPPGSEIRNVATCAFTVPAPPGERAFEDTVPSNPVTTPVVRDDCFETIETTVTVDPGPQAAPGDVLTWTVHWTRPVPSDLHDVAVTLAFEPGVLAPLDVRVEFDPALSPGLLPPGTGWDAATREVTWNVERFPAGTTARFVATVPVDPGLESETVIRARPAIEVRGCLDDPLLDPIDVVVVDPTLDVSKRADRDTVTAGDVVGYTVDVTHAPGGTGLDPVALVDVLPPGFRFVPGTARIGGAPSPDPDIESDGRTLRFELGAFSPGDSLRVAYAAIAAPGVPIGDAVNRAAAAGVTPGGVEIRSAFASVSVFVDDGPFSVRGVLAGRVFVDRDGDGRPGPGEPGVPGAFVFLADGRGAVTDVRGRWHVADVPPGLHVVRVDPSTLPPGVHARDASAEAPGVAGSRFVELRAGLLATVDLPTGPMDTPACTLWADGRALTVPQAALIEPGPDGSPRSDAAVHLSRAALDLTRATPTRDAGVRCEAAPRPAEAALTAILRDALAAHAPGRVEARVEVREPDPAAPAAGTISPAAEAEGPLDRALREHPSRVAILAPVDGERVSRGAVSIDVLFPTGHRPVLEVAGRPVPEDRIGVRSTLPRRGLTAVRYVGVPLEPGTNRIRFRAVPPDVATAASDVVERLVTVPGGAAALRVDLPDERWVADGVTPGTVVVREIDGAGVRTSGRTTVRIDADGAVPSTPDLDPLAPGLQVRLDDGRAEIRFRPTSTPGRARLRVRAGELEDEVEIPILPGARAWTVLGLAEARATGDGGVEGDGGGGIDVPSAVGDDDGRVAVYARGPLTDSLQLTARLDTDRDRDRDRLADPLERERDWSVFGDDAIAVEEAASSGRWYARIDGGAGFARWGDFRSRFDDVELARYDRALHGLSGRVETGRVAFQGFASESDQTAVRDVFEPDGTSGPFLLRRAPVVARSETVLVETRDRFRPEEIVGRRTLLRDLDYDVDPVAGTLMLRAPLSPFDADLDPIRLVVLYEARGGDDRLTAGGRVALRMGERTELGATAVREERDGDDLDLFGADLRWTPVAGTRVRAEVASTRGDGGDDATAWRLGVHARTRDDLTWELDWLQLPAAFANPGLIGSPELGSRRGSARLTWEATSDLRLRAEAAHAVQDLTDVRRTTASVDAERHVGPFTVLGGLAHARSDGPAVGRGESTLARAGLRGRWAKRWTLELTREQPLSGGDALGYPGRTRAGLGYRIRDGLRAFARQEWEDAESGTRDRTSVGVEGQLGERTLASQRWFLDGGDARAIRSATAVETAIPVRDGHRMTLSASRVWTVDGDDARDGTVLGTGYEIRGGRSSLTGRYEIRLGDLEKRHIARVGGALRLGESWSLLVREQLFVTEARDGSAGSSRRLEGRVGAAWRPDARRWQALAQVDHAVGGGATPASFSGVAPGAPSEPDPGPFDPGPSPGAGIGAGRGREAGVFDRDAWTLSLAVGARLTARQHLGVSWVGRRVDADPGDGVPSTRTTRTSLHWSARVHRRWTLGASLRRFDQDVGDRALAGYGVQAGFLAVRDLWIVAGWNGIERDDPDAPAIAGTDDGGFVGIRFRFDEDTLRDWIR